MNILILHGIGGKAGIHWQQWLHDELVKAGHNVVMPTLPDAEHPDRKTWLAEVTRYMSELLPEYTTIVAHSLAVPSALDYIEQSSSPVKSLISVSGFSHPMGHELNEYFLQEKDIDFSRITDKIIKPFVLFGDDDPYVDQEELINLAKSLHVEPIVFHDGGHLNTNSGFTEFPKVLEIIRKL